MSLMLLLQESQGVSLMLLLQESKGVSLMLLLQESQGNPRCSIRSRSPSPGRNRQPVLSGAQLKRHTPEPGKQAS